LVNETIVDEPVIKVRGPKNEKMEPGLVTVSGVSTRDLDEIVFLSSMQVSK
jgi:hypothetical protein